MNEQNQSPTKRRDEVITEKDLWDLAWTSYWRRYLVDRELLAGEKQFGDLSMPAYKRKGIKAKPAERGCT